MAAFLDFNSISRASVRGGLVGGVGHVFLAISLWYYFGLDDLLELASVKPLTGLYLFLGMFALGFVPIMFYLSREVISPALVVAVSMSLAAFSSWQAGPVEAPFGGPTPFGLYVLSWIVVVPIAWLFGSYEDSRAHRSTG